MRTCIVLVGSLLSAASANAATQTGELSGTTCTQFLETAEIAGLKSPAPGAESRAVEAARDELIITMFWVHGFETAKTGTPPRLDQAWLQDRVGKLARVCKAKGAGSMSIASAVAKL
jgi:hypothetical protein